MALSDAVLFATSHGHVIRCACCGHLEITFRSERLRLPLSDFHTVAQLVDRTWHDVQAAESLPERWQLTAETSAGPLSVTFSSEEIAALHELLHGAMAMLELDTLLENALHS